MINTHISDIFFNSDNYEAFDSDKGDWNQKLLLEYANDTLDHLCALGVDVPSAEELVDDFLKRI